MGISAIPLILELTWVNFSYNQLLYARQAGCGCGDPGFSKKTGLSADYWRASAMSVMNRAMSEYRAGNALYDVVLNNTDPLYIMAKEGMVAKYDSPTAKKYPKDQIDPYLGPISRLGIVGIVYNKNSLRPENAPRSLEDL